MVYGSSAYSVVAPKHCEKNVHQRFRAYSRAAWRNWEEDMDVPQEGEASIKVSKNENSNMDGVEFPKIVWQGWKDSRTRQV